MKTLDFYVCVSKGDLIGIDDSSGGYPWRIKKDHTDSTLHGVKFWPYNTKGLQEAQKYADIWNRSTSYGFEDMEVVKFTATIGDIQAEIQASRDGMLADHLGV